MVTAYSDDLPVLHQACLQEYQFCNAKIELTRQFTESDSSPLNYSAGDCLDEDDYYRLLIPDNLGSLEEELIGFLKDLSVMDQEELLRLQKWAVYERRLATVMIELIENRIRALQFTGYIVSTEVGVDQAEESE